jgi:hypothetical protein
MGPSSRSFAGVVSRRHGIVTVAELGREHGAHELDRLRRHGVLVPVHPGVFRLTWMADTFEARCAAIVAARPDVVVAGIAAARLWGFRHVFPPTIPDVVVASPLQARRVVARVDDLPASHVVERDDGIRLTTRERTWFDCAVHLTDEKFTALTDWLVADGVAVPALWRITRELSGGERRGARRVRRVVSARADWQRPAGSRLEARLRRALRRRGLDIVAAPPLQLPNAVTVHLAAAAPTHRWAVEVDHVGWHGGRFGGGRVGRVHPATRIGWRVERVTDLDYRADPGAVADRLVADHAAWISQSAA